MITVEHLFHSYAHDGTFQVNDVSFRVEKGEIFGFLGPNGAGKSTTQKILTGLLPLQKGRVAIAGVEIEHSDRRLLNKIGVSFEHPNVYRKLTGLENLTFFADLYDVPTADPRELLRLLGLGEAMGKRAGEYSKGMLQRLVLARSLLNRPEIWFLDEPTSGLDPATAAMIKDLIREKQAGGTTIFLTTHNMHDAEELCDRVAFLNEGRIAALDTPRNLQLAHGERRVLVEYRDGTRVAAELLSLEQEAGRRRLHELTEHGLVETIHSQEASLEQIFIAVTGRGLK
ncbi:MAG TPA: ABC transporter ATP-binding protein [Symbiobacteriaceae bacterium]|nr:ABC transporter ATP-binding protein [Symbiobacteriaceae bacterium]